MPKEAITIETERLILRPFILDDIAPSNEMNLDARVSKFTGDGGIVGEAEIERRIKENVMGDYAKYGYGRWAVELKGGKKFIGFAGLKFMADLNEVDLGYRLLFDYWGKGLATEAAKACLDYGFNTLQLKRIIATVLPDNIGSVRVLEKVGMQYEKEFIEDGLFVKQYCIQQP
ncbi:MAG: ribosomal-protein-alanine N-acetyltransferase [Crocinitomix sp.]|jgi:ribosomal-protein-alanine N-acetyltransferase